MTEAQEVEQRTDEWRRFRLGKLTASRIADATAKTKTGYGASRANYMAELLAERLTQAPYEQFVSAAMQRGTDLEPDAIAAYEFRMDVEVEPVGFCVHPEIEAAGASPDGLIADDGLVEVKCPNTSTHINWLLGAKIDEKYVKQMMWQMTCTGRKYCDFVSYEPRLPEPMCTFVQRIHRDDDVIADLESEARAFLKELDEKEAQIRAKFEKAAA